MQSFRRVYPKYGQMHRRGAILLRMPELSKEPTLAYTMDLRTDITHISNDLGHIFGGERC